MRKPSEDSLPPERNAWLTIDDFGFICFDFTREYLTFDEPIPDYSTRENALLESALGSPRQSFGGRFLYPTLAKQASILFYSLIKNHPFKNGNKRIAVMSLLVFLSLNNRWLSIEPYDLYKFAQEVAKTETKEKDKMLKTIEETIEKTLIQFPTNKF
ncbi:MAG: type II toxin-antitoxin system death-on-curing family toxin [Candidatus Levybacteria bacterium]|nr:type II toxin-antitoxin system death-on-curing family toxin [Candidatus Levybacteria bacterium]